MTVWRRAVLERLRDHLIEKDMVVAASGAENLRIESSDMAHAIAGAVNSMNAMQAPVAALFPPRLFSDAT